MFSVLAFRLLDGAKSLDASCFKTPKLFVKLRGGESAAAHDGG